MFYSIRIWRDIRYDEDREHDMNGLVERMRDLLPVQKCLAGHDIAKLTDQDLLAVVLGTGVRGRDVIDVAGSLIREFGGLRGIRRAGIREIAGISGVGLTKSIRIHAALEMGRRIISEEEHRTALDSPSRVWGLIRQDVVGIDREEFRVLILNNKNHLLKNSVVSVGTISEAVVHPREIFRDAIREAASSIIVAHNHPSGVLAPSREDIAATERIKKAGEIIGIPLIDHVIVSDRSFLSMKEEGYL